MKKPVTADIVASPSQSNIDSIQKEKRLFEAPKEFSRRAHIRSREEYERIYRDAERDPEGFWAGIEE